jgi:dihydrofolate reductase
MITGHVFIAISLDGYIARLDGDINWLLQRDDPEEDHGYPDFIADKNCIVMGRGSYEKALSIEKWPYERPVLVLSKQLVGTPVPKELHGKVSFSNLTPAETMKELARKGLRRVYVDGGQIVQSFLREGLIADMVITTVPVLIGTGRPLFGALPRDTDPALVFSRSFPSGLVQTTYRVLR